MLTLALLRAINVSGKNMIRMPDLVRLCEGLGWADVQTLLQTGNVVFRAPSNMPYSTLERACEEALQAQMGLEVSVMVRSAEQWGAIITHAPFSADQLAEPSRVLVTALKAAPDPALGAAWLTSFDGPEQLTLHEATLYAYFPQGMGQSKLGNPQIERKLKVLGTGRNWNTVIKLAHLLGVQPKP
jgi:uncharacterized protein (DUF1697 family)